MATAFCPGCGSPRSAAFRYCASCGLDLDAAPTALTLDKPPPQPTGWQTPAPLQRTVPTGWTSPAQPSNDSPQRDVLGIRKGWQRGGKARIWAVFVAIFVVLLLLGLAARSQTTLGPDAQQNVRKDADAYLQAHASDPAAFTFDGHELTFQITSNGRPWTCTVPTDSQGYAPPGTTVNCH
jgi:hypothetical protein